MNFELSSSAPLNGRYLAQLARGQGTCNSSLPQLYSHPFLVLCTRFYMPGSRNFQSFSSFHAKVSHIKKRGPTQYVVANSHWDGGTTLWIERSQANSVISPWPHPLQSPKNPQIGRYQPLSSWPYFQRMRGEIFFFLSIPFHSQPSILDCG